ncbi:MAG: hypothetical protein WBK67_00590 [Minisyncoccales bacterium]|jgi:hypothetical protein
MKKDSLNLLNNLEVIKWCYEGITDTSLKNTDNEKKLKEAKEIEKKWGNKIIGKSEDRNIKQWTTTLCESVVEEALIILGRKNIRRVKPVKSSIRDKRYSPDLECDDYVYEIKGRNWCTPGTAGEKILGVPLKYGELPRLFNKPLKIILVAYQEYEAKQKFAFGDLLDKNNQTKELQDSLFFYKGQKIEYVAFTDILKQIGFNYGCWK